MLTYNLSEAAGESLYEKIYNCIKKDILDGVLACDQKLPSKRTFASHLQVSVITVQTAYEQLIAEGYIKGVEKKGYYVLPIDILPRPAKQSVPVASPSKEEPWLMDFVTNSAPEESFPFQTWAKLMRKIILDHGPGLLKASEAKGTAELRTAIADYLYHFRGMPVDPEQVIIGAGTEFLYNVIVQLLGRDKIYAVEDPGHRKIARIYESIGVTIRRIGLDDRGLCASELNQKHADVVHITPDHHYPTGIVMPIGRRYELLRWAADKEGRYILEDDYDSEFRFRGKPVPTLYSTDTSRSVVYLNTFSKTIAPSIRISYMVLPYDLLELYNKKLGFYACTVSSLEQYTLAGFISNGHFEKHLNRMKIYYHRKRNCLAECMGNGPLTGKVDIIEYDAGLHFLVRLHTALSDEEFKEKAKRAGINVAMLSDYYHDPANAPEHLMIMNYSGIHMEKLPEALKRIAEWL